MRYYPRFARRTPVEAEFPAVMSGMAMNAVVHEMVGDEESCLFVIAKY